MFCDSHRDFIENQVVDFAKQNPGIVVYLKPRRHRAPHVKLEYCEYLHDVLLLHYREWLSTHTYIGC